MLVLSFKAQYWALQNQTNSLVAWLHVLERKHASTWSAKTRKVVADFLNHNLEYFRNTNHWNSVKLQGARASTAKLNEFAMWFF